MSLEVLGGWLSRRVDGYVRVRKNVVWGKGIRAIVLGYSAAQGWDVELVGRMGSGPPDVVSTLHPEYDVGIGRHTTGVFSSGVYADFTPYADPADVRRLMDIDFSCLTRWRSCQTGADIAPTVWNEATAENENGGARNVGQRTCGPAVVRVLARESRRAVIGEVSRISIYAGLYNDSNHRPYDPSDFGQVKILFKGDLKRMQPDPLGDAKLSYESLGIYYRRVNYCPLRRSISKLRGEASPRIAQITTIRSSPNRQRLRPRECNALDGAGLCVLDVHGQRE